MTKLTVDIEVNGQVLTCKKGSMLLDVLREYGIRVPTLCSLTGYAPTGACRLCVVEMKGQEDLVPACSFPVNEAMKVKTHSARVIQARRTIVELLISGHPDDCLYCLQAKHCELQKLATELNVSERKSSPIRPNLKIDQTSAAVVHDPAKCVLCGRCIRICDQLGVSALEFVNRGAELRVGTIGGKGLNYSTCISCGQCIQSCPTGSLQEKGHIDELIDFLQQKANTTIAIIDPAVMISVSDELGFRTGKDLSQLIYAALRKLGFAQVYSGSEASDLSFYKTGQDWHGHIKNDKGPAVLSYCPAFLEYLEHFHADLLDRVIPGFNPTQLFAHLLKRKFGDSYIVYFTTCTAAKHEAPKTINQTDGKPSVNAVMSTTELLQLVRIFGIDFERLSPEVPDSLFQLSSISNLLPASSGGWLEGLYRAMSILFPEEYPRLQKVPKLRGAKPEKIVSLADTTGRQVWLANSEVQAGVKLIKEAIDQGQNTLFEIMACPGGCINGGGQTGEQSDKLSKSRLKEINDRDSGYAEQLKPFVMEVLTQVDEIMNPGFGQDQ